MNIPDVVLDLGQRPASVSTPRGTAGPARSDPVDFEAVLDARSGNADPCLSATYAEGSADAALVTAVAPRQGPPAPSPVPESELPAQDTPPPNEPIEAPPTNDVGPQAAVAAQMPVQIPPATLVTVGLSKTAAAPPTENAAVVLPGAALLDSVSVKATLSGSTDFAAGLVAADEAVTSTAQFLQGEVAGQAPNADQGAPVATMLLPQDSPTALLLPGTEEPAPSPTSRSAELKVVSSLNGAETSAAPGASAPVEEMDGAALMRGAWTNAASDRSSRVALSQAVAEEAGASRAAVDPVRVSTALPREAADPVRGVQAPPPATESGTVVHGAAKAEAPLAPPAPPAPPETVSLEIVRDFAVRSVRYLVTRGERTVTVRLVPESLGELHLEVTSAKEGLFVRLISANPAVREFLSEGLHNLRVALAESGVSAADVLVTADMASGHPAAEGRTPEWAGSARSPGPAAPRLDVPAEAGLAHNTTSPHEGALNVLV